MPRPRPLRGAAAGRADRTDRPGSLRRPPPHRHCRADNHDINPLGGRHIAGLNHIHRAVDHESWVVVDNLLHHHVDHRHRNHHNDDDLSTPTTSTTTASATTTTTTTAAPEPPIANDDSRTLEDVGGTDVIANDSPGSTPLVPGTLRIVVPPTHGIAWVTGAHRIRFDPDDWEGTTSLVYEICDQNSLCDDATLTITVID